MKADICELKNEPLQKDLSKESIIQAFAGAGIWPVDATRAMDRLKRRKSKNHKQLMSHLICHLLLMLKLLLRI